ncbi:DUF5131 family protein [Inquilinus sp. CA228]|uniref:DUF5131 family protein n=1 Tax=Inquilinus sp. CA228 TaxID=3455609 RepID=UPI003F8D4D5E
MADHTGIEWAEATWNPVVGCSLVSPGCSHCYAMKLAARIERMGGKAGAKYSGLTQPSKAGPVWTGTVRLDQDALLQPLRWRRPRRIFANSMSDLFHEGLSDDQIDQVFAVMALADWHTFIVLTKRADRMHAYLTDSDLGDRISAALGCMLDGDWIWQAGKQFRDRIEHLIGAFIGEDQDDHGNIVYYPDPTPLPNVILGVSIEDQARADERVPQLLATPAALRIVSAEPLLGPIDLACVPRPASWPAPADDIADGIDPLRFNPRLDGVIVGGESGHAARPMHPDWARSLRDQCQAAGVPFFFKQWGEWKNGSDFAADAKAVTNDGRVLDPTHDAMYAADREERVLCPTLMRKVGKRRAGRLLDGRTWDEMPAVRR